METDDLISPTEAAKRLGLRRTSVYHLASNGGLPKVEIAGHTFFRSADVDVVVAKGPRPRGRPRKPKGADDA